MFAYSKHHHYTHHSLNFVSYYNKTYHGNIQLEIVNNRCYIYDDDCLVKGGDVFYFWFKRLQELRAQYPKNSLLKNFGSRAWGSLSTQNVIVKTEQEIIDEEINCSDDYSKDYFIKDIIKKDSGDIYKLVDTKKLYKMQFRLKAFITDFARVKTAKVALLDIDSVLRIQTDNITYSCEIHHKNEPDFRNIG